MRSYMYAESGRRLVHTYYSIDLFSARYTPHRNTLRGHFRDGKEIRIPLCDGDNEASEGFMKRSSSRVHKKVNLNLK